MATPSPREAAQQRLVEHLSAHDEYWSAPYGVLASLHRLDRGAVRVVTFGVSRWLDATAYVWLPTRVEVRAQGALASRVEGVYGSVDELISRLEELY